MSIPARLIASIPNLRDMGGIMTGAGRMLAHDRLYRSSHFAALDEQDRETLHGLGIRTVVDLRGVEERAGAPARHRPGTVEVHLPIEPRSAGMLHRMRAEGSAGDDAVIEVMKAAYRRFAREHTQAYSQLFRLLLDESRLPLVFHCTAGKDRTGFAAALILMALGGSPEAILEDYLATNERWRPTTAEGQAVTVAIARRDYLEAAIGEIERGWGDIDTYLREPIGLSDADRELLARRLLA